MKLEILATAVLVSVICYAMPAQAANPVHVRQLLKTGEYPGCDLTGF